MAKIVSEKNWLHHITLIQSQQAGTKTKKKTFEDKDKKAEWLYHLGAGD